MFVCLGNICRSPAAEAVCRTVLKRRGLEGQIEVSSSGTCGFHEGEPSDSRMRQAAQQRGIEIIHTSRKLRREDLDAYDMILAMDRENYEDILAMADTDAQRKKTALFRDFDPQGTGDVPDPYYGGRGGFHRVMEIIERTCEGLADSLEEKAGA